MPRACSFPLLLALAWAPPAFSMDGTTTEVAHGDMPPDARLAWVEMAKVKRLEARFRQTRHSSLLAEPLVSTGTLRFARPDRLSWLVKSPSRSEMVMRGTTVAVRYPDLGVSETVDLASSPEASRVVRGMMVWLGGDLDQVLEDYDVTWRPGGGGTAVLTPKVPELTAVLSQVEIHLAGDPLRVERVHLVEPAGDRVEILLQDIRINADLPDDAFSLPDAPR